MNSGGRGQLRSDECENAVERKDRMNREWRERVSRLVGRHIAIQAIMLCIVLTGCSRSPATPAGGVVGSHVLTERSVPVDYLGTMSFSDHGKKLDVTYQREVLSCSDQQRFVAIHVRRNGQGKRVDDPSTYTVLTDGADRYYALGVRFGSHEASSGSPYYGFFAYKSGGQTFPIGDNFDPTQYKGVTIAAENPAKSPDEYVLFKVPADLRQCTYADHITTGPVTLEVPATGSSPVTQKSPTSTVQSAVRVETPSPAPPQGKFPKELVLVSEGPAGDSFSERLFQAMTGTVCNIRVELGWDIPKGDSSIPPAIWAALHEEHGGGGSRWGASFPFQGRSAVLCWGRIVSSPVAKSDFHHVGLLLDRVLCTTSPEKRQSLAVRLEPSSLWEVQCREETNSEDSLSDEQKTAISMYKAAKGLSGAVAVRVVTAISYRGPSNAFASAIEDELRKEYVGKPLPGYFRIGSRECFMVADAKDMQTEQGLIKGSIADFRKSYPLAIVENADPLVWWTP